MFFGKEFQTILFESFQVYPADLLKKFRVSSNLDQCLIEVDQSRNLAVAISQEHAHNSRLIPFSKLYCFQASEIIYEYALKFLVRRNFPLTPKLNEFIRTASATGLIKKWHDETQIQYQFKNQKPDNNQLILRDTLSVGILGFLCFILIFICFLFETFVHKRAKKTNPSLFWLLAEMFIDGDRQFLLETKII